jgi:hypothetical protein
MTYVRIWWLSVVAAVLYGILHDHVTTRICVEYFTIAHPPILHRTGNPTLLAFGWGILATWWVGLRLGVPLLLVARLGPRPKLGAADLWRPIGVLLGGMAVCSIVAGVIGWQAGLDGQMSPRWVKMIPAEKHVAFTAVAWAHTAAYQACFLGGLALWMWTWVKRWQLARRNAAKELTGDRVA